MPVRGINITNFALLSLGATVTGYLIYKYVSARYKKELHPSEVLPVRVCNHLAEWVSSEKKFLQVFYEAKVVGMDCEWVTINDHRNPVALLQLATAEGFCVLVRLCNIPPWLMPSGLVNLLNDGNVIKVGVGICEDAQKLLQDYGITVRGCLDLRQMVQDKEEFKDKSLSLQVLADFYLNAKLKKNVSLTCSNWEAERLTPKQIAYAAEDALASAQIYEKLTRKQIPEDSEPAPETSFVDVPYKHSSVKVKDNLGKVPKQSPRKKIREKQIICRTKVMYENCQLQAPDGEVLCSCDRKKAQWYLDKGRATVVTENPLVVRLNFEPSGRPILDNNYYVQEKKNCCVVCGDTRLFFRKSIVPSEYRRYFPNLMKRNLSHDVLLLCVTCHRKSNLLDQSLRQQLAKECNAPIEIGPGVKLKMNQQLGLVKSSAKALLKSKDKLPKKRREQLEKAIRDYYQVEDISEDLLKKASRVQTFMLNENYVPHGWKVFQHVCQNGGLIQFESRWRKHFLDTMHPKFLPKMWSVNHNHERLALQVTKNAVDFDISILGLNDELLEKVKNLNL